MRWSTGGLWLGLALATPGLAQAAEHNRVAVVVGLSTYGKLPKEVHLDFARSDAATVAQALEKDAGFTVFLLRDGEATKEAIRETLRGKAAQLVGPDDVFVLYFVGHGVGADLGSPVLLAHDSTLENGQEDGLELQAFVRDLQTWTHAGTNLIVLDAIHRNQLDGIFFYGPSASQWPVMPRGYAVLSASQPSSAGKDGAFGPVFAKGIGGAADADGDHGVQISELTGWLDQQDLGGQKPQVAGDFDPKAFLSSKVTGSYAPTATAPLVVTPPPVVVINQKAPTPPPPPEKVFPDVVIPAAKFVWLEGGSQAVKCASSELVACAPSCYVRTFKAGTCELTAVVNGVSMTGSVDVTQAGKYDCQPKSGTLVCTGP